MRGCFRRPITESHIDNQDERIQIENGQEARTSRRSSCPSRASAPRFCLITAARRFMPQNGKAMLRLTSRILAEPSTIHVEGNQVKRSAINQSILEASTFLQRTALSCRPTLIGPRRNGGSAEVKPKRFARVDWDGTSPISIRGVLTPWG